MKRLQLIGLILINSLIQYSSFAQIEINNSIVNKTGDTLSIKNLGSINDTTQLTRLETVRAATTTFISATITSDTLFFSIDTTVTPLKKGLVLFVTSNGTNTNRPWIKLNGNVYPLVKSQLQPIAAGEIITNKIHLVVFVDTYFLLINPEKGTCPTNMIRVNEKYCIDRNETLGTFWTAVTSCSNRNLKLCSWSEWYYACFLRTSLGLQNMTNNWEWINQSQNEPWQAKSVGNGRCDITIHNPLTTSIGFRCCYDY